MKPMTTQPASPLPALSAGERPLHLVVMGVAGSGKSSFAAWLAAARSLPLIEGDDHHTEASRQKMTTGVPLTDEDREQWLGRLCQNLANQRDGAILSCSALRRRYRDQLRRTVPDLRFAFLAIERDHAYQRVLARPGHYFSPALVDSQFATLESPSGEPGVLTLDALLPPPQLQARLDAWLRGSAVTVAPGAAA